MDKRVIIVVVCVGAALLGGLLMTMLAPDTGPDVVRTPRKMAKARPVPDALPAIEPIARPRPAPAPKPALEPIDDVELEFEQPKPDEPEIEPDLVYEASAEGLERAFDQHKKDFWACYAPFIVRYSSLHGAQVKLTFNISEDEEGGGRITNAFVEESEADLPRLDNCLLDVWRELDFDPPEGGGKQEFSFRMRLKPR